MTAEQRKAIARDWRKAAEDALQAASVLRQNGHYRSSVSRSYYAAYAFLAEALVRQASVLFKSDREGPEHESLPDLVQDHLKNKEPFSYGVLQQMRADIRKLYGYRLQADYRPRASVRDAMALEALQRATTIATSVRRMRD